MPLHGSVAHSSVWESHVPVPSFLVPPAQRAHPGWSVLSVASHAVLIVLLVLFSGRTFREETTRLITLTPGAFRARAYPVPALSGGGAGGLTLLSFSDLPLVEMPESIPPLPERDVRLGFGEAAADSAPGPVGTRRRLGPAYADGRLWVRGLVAELGVVGPSDDVATHVAEVGRAVRERLKAFIDTMPRDSFAVPPPPRWTTEVDGNTWGIDQSWIYLGNIKLPSALLALIPFPQGNYDRAKAEAELLRIRQDILQAARRAETAEDFRRYVEETRKRKDEERDARRAAERSGRRDTIKP